MSALWKSRSVELNDTKQSSPVAEPSGSPWRLDTDKRQPSEGGDVDIEPPSSESPRRRSTKSRSRSANSCAGDDVQDETMLQPTQFRCPLLDQMKKEGQLVANWVNEWSSSYTGLQIKEVALRMATAIGDKDLNALKRNAAQIFEQTSYVPSSLPVSERPESPEGQRRHMGRWLKRVERTVNSLEDDKRVSKVDFIVRLGVSNAAVNHLDNSTKGLPLPGMLGHRIFEFFDTDHSGGLDFMEMFDAVLGVTFADLRTLLRFLFSLYDLDNSRTLNLQESLVTFDHVQEYLRETQGDASELSAASYRPDSLVRNIFTVATHLDPPSPLPPSHAVGGLARRSLVEPSIARDAELRQTKQKKRDDESGATTPRCPELITDISVERFVKACMVLKDVRHVLETFFAALIPTFESIVPGLCELKTRFRKDSGFQLRLHDHGGFVRVPEDKSEDEAEATNEEEEKPRDLQRSGADRRGRSWRSILTPRRVSSTLHAPPSCSETAEPDPRLQRGSRLSSVMSKIGGRNPTCRPEESNSIHLPSTGADDPTETHTELAVCEGYVARCEIFHDAMLGFEPRGSWTRRSVSTRKPSVKLLWIVITPFHLYVYPTKELAAEDPLNALQVFDLQNLSVSAVAEPKKDLLSDTFDSNDFDSNQGFVPARNLPWNADHGWGFMIKTVATNRYRKCSVGSTQTRKKKLNDLDDTDIGLGVAKQGIVTSTKVVVETRAQRVKWLESFLKLGCTDSDTRYHKQYLTVTSIGLGQYGRVFGAINRADPDSPLFAVKVIDMNPAEYPAADHPGRIRAGFRKIFHRPPLVDHEGASSRLSESQVHQTNEMSIMRLVANMNVSCMLVEVIGGRRHIRASKSYMIMEFMDAQVGTVLDRICAARYHKRMPSLGKRMAMLDVCQATSRKKNPRLKDEPDVIEGDDSVLMDDEVNASFQCHPCFAHEHETEELDANPKLLRLTDITTQDVVPKFRLWCTSSYYSPPWELFSKCIVSQSVVCLAVLHSSARNIVHRDIKPENTLLKFKRYRNQKSLQPYRVRSRICASVLSLYMSFEREVTSKVIELLIWIDTHQSESVGSWPEIKATNGGDILKLARAHDSDTDPSISEDMTEIVEGWLEEFVSLMDVLKSFVVESQNIYNMPPVVDNDQKMFRVNDKDWLNVLSSGQIFDSDLYFDDCSPPRMNPQMTDGCSTKIATCHPKLALECSQDERDPSEEDLDSMYDPSLNVDEMKRTVKELDLDPRWSKLVLLNLMTVALEGLLANTIEIKLADFGFSQLLAPPTNSATREGLSEADDQGVGEYSDNDYDSKLLSSGSSNSRKCGPRRPPGDHLNLNSVGPSSNWSDESRPPQSTAPPTSETLPDLVPLASRTAEPLGTPAYCAPEVVRKNTAYGVGIDMWSLGMMCYQLLSGGLSPLRCCWINALRSCEPNRSSRVVQVDEEGHRSGRGCGYLGPGILALPCHTWRTVGLNARQFVNQCLVVDPFHRLSSQRAKHHPWLKQTCLMVSNH
eukprot:GHVH01012755.1.p1 GENE.GHVH01012755.1~~GHVH01012755.1.p1  ORF type:complete len:1504 (-),score=230.10 GHVH01012755.1:1295-5806(-)